MRILFGSIRKCSQLVTNKAINMSEPVLRIRQGEVRGKVYKTFNGVEFYGFLGIPYAKPPVGDLRFKPPVPPDSWTGIRDATEEGNVSTQLDRSRTGSVIGDEDCLLLNVFTRNLKPDGEPFPVMVYVHGGGFVHGSKDSERHGPHFLIEEGVVFVSYNYRLGILGFLNLDLPEAQGNMGLKDQAQALKWIKDNISFFNGDPSNVTLFGSSAGGASVELLCLSQVADGLFHKAIAQSGSSLNHWAKGNKIKDFAFSIAKRNGAEVKDTNELLKYLKDLPAADLVNCAYSVVSSEGAEDSLIFGFVPSVEKEFPHQQSFITEDTLQLLKRGDFLKVPYIAGFCRRESLLITASNPKYVEKLVSNKYLIRALPFAVDDSHQKIIEDRLQTVYIDTIKPEDEEDNFVIDFLTDVTILSGIYVAAKLMAQKNFPVYFYEFAYDGKLNYLKTALKIERSGACHSDDGGYTCYSSFLPIEVSETDELVRKRMVKMWANFAKFGNPTPEKTELLSTTWKPLSTDSFDYLIIDADLTMTTDLAPERMSMFEDLYLNK